MMPHDATTLTISRLIKAPPATVWRAWAEPQHFAKWWIPAPIECQVVKMDLTPGGGFETRMREGDGPFNPHVKGCFLDVVPGQRLIFTTLMSEGWQPIEPWLALTAVITLTAQEGGTLYASRVLHRTEAEAKKHDEMGFQQGWGMAIDQLAAVTATL